MPDQLFSIRQILEKCKEYNAEIHQLFVDFKAAYDSANRRKLWRVMEEFGIPNKLISLVKLTLKGANGRVRIRNKLSDAFDIKEGLRQGDPLASLLFTEPRTWTPTAPFSPKPVNYLALQMTWTSWA